MNFDIPLPVRTIVHCTSCKRPVELQLTGTSGVSGYDTYNEFLCPHCRKVNFPRTSGHILAARIAAPA